MSEQLNQIQSMMEQLIKMVGSNNAALEELRQDTKASVEGLRQELKETKAELKTDIAALDAKVEQYGQVQQQDVYHLLAHIDKKTDSIMATQTTQGESINILVMRQLQMEAEVAASKKAK
ncbi:hypothetical protein [Sporomusa termitida]|uniref:Uncharacterized protein n=1 Tax=Sporomusa termitida TaxID=2377 RepID=A0A517DTQ6_9FIRM|nr:hypothetical protein [Sporomusa termitida]QDR80730.1 hypothetical protein SPTER_20630 [Sporomusa termitida]